MTTVKLLPRPVHYTKIAKDFLEEDKDFYVSIIYYNGNYHVDYSKHFIDFEHCKDLVWTTEEINGGFYTIEIDIQGINISFVSEFNNIKFDIIKFNLI